MAFARIESGPHAGRFVPVVEFSRQGCRLRDSGIGCAPGDTLEFMLEDIGPLVADVRWCKGAFVGVTFRMALAGTVIEHLQRSVARPLPERMAKLPGGAKDSGRA